MSKCIVTAILGVLLFASRTAVAFVDPPVLVPSNPEAGQLVSISAGYGVCDAFTADPPTITRTGNNIRMVLASAWEIDPFCIFPTGADSFAVGTFEAGEYTLQVDRTYLGFNGQVTEPVGTLLFAVSPIPVVPALNVFGAALLAALVVAVMLRRSLRVKQRI